MSSIRHPTEFRRAFVDALALLHVESVVWKRLEENGPLVLTRVAGAIRRTTGPDARTISVRGTAQLALAVDVVAGFDSSGTDGSGVEPRSGVHYNLGFRLLAQGSEGGGPWNAPYFLQKAGVRPFPECGGIAARPRGSGYNPRSLDLVNQAKATWAWLDENVFTLLDATLAAESRAVVAGARVSYVAQLNAKFGTGAYS
jgi:hypothetical protein